MSGNYQVWAADSPADDYTMRSAFNDPVAAIAEAYNWFSKEGYYSVVVDESLNEIIYRDHTYVSEDWLV